MLTEREINHKTYFLLREIVGNVLIGGRVALAVTVLATGTYRLSKRPLNWLDLCIGCFES